MRLSVMECRLSILGRLRDDLFEGVGECELMGQAWRHCRFYLRNVKLRFFSPTQLVSNKASSTGPTRSTTIIPDSKHRYLESALTREISILAVSVESNEIWDVEIEALLPTNAVILVHQDALIHQGIAGHLSLFSLML
ncbi:hypothetical protein BDW62DRAFT_57944 [Aspergillus aurantiobrunneus]